jgi:XTP/dITP diphosphohydrolase
MVIADDSGLCVNALNGIPGIYSSRFLGDRPYLEKQLALIDMLKDKDDKSAYFNCTIVLIYQGKEKVFNGKVDGTIVSPRSGNYGFGYDPIFLPNGYDLTFNQMEDELKNKISHRGNASAKLLDYILKNILKMK